MTSEPDSRIARPDDGASANGEWIGAARFGVTILLGFLILVWLSTLETSETYTVDFTHEYGVVLVPWILTVVILAVAGVSVSRVAIPRIAAYTVIWSLQVGLILAVLWPQVGRVVHDEFVSVLHDGYNVPMEMMLWSVMTVMGLCIFVALADHVARRD
jgi:hypothetical protein